MVCWQPGRTPYPDLLHHCRRPAGSGFVIEAWHNGALRLAVEAKDRSEAGRSVSVASDAPWLGSRIEKAPEVCRGDACAAARGSWAGPWKAGAGSASTMDRSWPTTPA